MEETAMEQRPARLPYEPPEIQKIVLARDELAVTGCKTNSSGGPTTGCFRSACKDLGS